MSTKKWKNGELKSLLSEAWGFKMDLSKLNESQELYGEMGGCGDDVTGIEMVDGEEVGVTDVDDAEGAANELLALAHKIAGMLGQDSSVTSVPDGDEEADLEERRGRGRENHTIRGPKDNRLRPEGKELSEAQIRTLIRKALKEAAKIKGK